MQQTSQGSFRDDPNGDRTALISGTAHLWFWFIAAVVVAIDLWSKSWAFDNLPADGAREWIPGLLEFRRSLNDGAVFGSFTGYVNVFIVASLLALAFVLYMFIRSGARQRFLHLSLALIFAGAVGNLYDRMFIKADVVAFPNDPDHRSIVGMVLSDPDDPQVVVGEWPDGARRRSFAPSEVSIRQQGVVRDFLKFTPEFPDTWGRFGGYPIWPWVFNIADAALVCGVTMLLLSSLFERRPEPARVTGVSTAGS